MELPLEASSQFWSCQILLPPIGAFLGLSWASMGPASVCAVFLAPAVLALNGAPARGVLSVLALRGAPARGILTILALSGACPRDVLTILALTSAPVRDVLAILSLSEVVQCSVVWFSLA